VPNLRLAPGPDDEQARASLLEEMENFANRSASRRRKKPATAEVAYAARIANDRWRGKRAAEFKALLQEWNKATGITQSGGLLLQELSALCDREDARGTQVEGSDGLVFEFTVTLEPRMAPVRVWRRLDDHVMPDLRLAPEPDNEETRADLLKQMKVSANKSERKQKKAVVGS
jgi:hypothetical protein